MRRIHASRVQLANFKTQRYNQNNSDAEWQAARLARLRLDNFTCTRCPAKTELQVHHKVPISKGGHRTALSNLRTLCLRCHQLDHKHKLRSYSFKKKY